jgi:hypothetical protein
MKEHNDDKEQLVNKLLDIMNIDDEFYKNVNHILDMQLENVLKPKAIDIVKIFCKDNFKKFINKRRKKHFEFYMDFTESELADMIIYHNSDAHRKLKEKSGSISKINQDIMMEILNDKNLNLLVNRLISKSEEKNN